MKKLMILGAMETHISLIKRAKELGFYTITVDYIPENPGHKIADEAHFDSTTDKEAVLKLAKKLKIDGIMTFCSDPAAPTVAYVQEKLGLKGNSYKTVKTMSEKDLFRSFLKENKMNVPHSCGFENFLSAKSHLKDFVFPIIIKPVDSSGSKGCTVIQKHNEHDENKLKKAVDACLDISRCKRFVIEEYIENDGPQLHGDGFVLDGKLVDLFLGDHHFDKSLNNLVPVSTTFPSVHTDDEIQMCKKEVETFLKKVGFKNGGFNVELRISKKDGKPYIIDIGARNGGNFVPNLIQHAYGFNFLDAAINVAMGENLYLRNCYKNLGFYSHLVLHSKLNGIISEINLSSEIKKRIVEEHIYKKAGDTVSEFLGANTAVGVLILKYENLKIMNEIIDSIDKYYEVRIEKQNTIQRRGGVLSR